MKRETDIAVSKDEKIKALNMITDNLVKKQEELKALIFDISKRHDSDYIKEKYKKPHYYNYHFNKKDIVYSKTFCNLLISEYKKLCKQYGEEIDNGLLDNIKKIQEANQKLCENAFYTDPADKKVHEADKKFVESKRDLKGLILDVIAKRKLGVESHLICPYCKERIKLRIKHHIKTKHPEKEQYESLYSDYFKDTGGETVYGIHGNYTS
ncbi:MAG: hypothetical protein ABIF08_00335, partial [Nanoarchaeota archaeon]